MFDGSLPEPEELPALTDNELLDAMKGWARTASAADARKLAAIAEFAHRRCANDPAAWWRDQGRASRIQAERAHNAARIDAERAQPPQSIQPGTSLA